MSFHNVNFYSDDSALVIELTSAYGGAPCRLFLCRDRDDLLILPVLDHTDVLLVDERLAQVDTWSMARRLRQHAGDRPVAVIGLVDALSNELLDRSKEYGVDAFMLKSAVGPNLPRQIGFVARAVPTRDADPPDSPFLEHGVFLDALRQQIEVVKSAAGALPELQPGSTQVKTVAWKERADATSTITRFKRAGGTTRGSTSVGSGEGEVPDLIGVYLGKVLLQKEIGRGAGGAVFAGQHSSLDMQVAVKVLYPNLVEHDPEFAARFLAEARTAARMQVGGVVRVFDCDRDTATGCFYIVMEYVEGSSLRDEIKRAGRVPERRLTEMAIDIASSLMVAEDLGIVHRDIKPENILISSTGLVKLADLGLVKQVESTQGLASGRLETRARSGRDRVMGTPFYIAPEQINDPAGVDSRADIYSLGATLYHALVGEVPFPGADYGEIFFQHLNTAPLPIHDRRPEVSRELSEIVQKMMGKRPRQRYSSCRELHGVLIAHRDFLVAQAALSRAAPERTQRKTR